MSNLIKNCLRLPYLPGNYLVSEEKGAVAGIRQRWPRRGGGEASQIKPFEVPVLPPQNLDFAGYNSRAPAYDTF